MTDFLATHASILNPYCDENMHEYVSNEEAKRKMVTINNQNKSQEIGIQVSFNLKINL